MSPDEVVFDGQTYLLLPSAAKALRTAPPAGPDGRPAEAAAGPAVPVESEAAVATASPVMETAGTRRIRLSGSIPPEVWNRVGNRLLPKLRSGVNLDVSVGFEIEVDAATADHFLSEIRQILEDLALSGRVCVN
jgi:hypothetical protein